MTQPFYNQQVKEAAPRRSVSARLTHNPQPRYHGDDLISEGSTFTSYVGWDQPGSSRMHQPDHAGWEQPAPQHAQSSWQQGSSEQCQDGNFDYYQQQQYEKV